MRGSMIVRTGGRAGSRARLAGALVASAALVLALTACGGSGSDGSTDQLVGPVTADLTSIDGTTVTVPVGGVVDLTGDDETFTEWTADIDDPEIVSFTPGKTEGDTSFNPGLVALEEGDSDVTLTNEATGDTVSFEVEVTPKG